MRKVSVGLASALLLSTGCARLGSIVGVGPLADPAPPPILREMRGVWIATVANIDWPSKDTLTADIQRAELVDLLDRAVSHGFNAVVFQVRPAGDAVYPSALEPWAALLTGKQGTDPGYDPLAFAIAEAHARGLELHAWINPFRAGNTRDTAKFAATHNFNARRDLLRIYGTQVWSDPGEPDVQEHAMRVVRDIVQRYDIDGIHADDYFYPYQERDSSGRFIEFPDSGSYARSGTQLSIGDWRRSNVDRFIERMYRETHQLKPQVKVGISPFGIWRPGYPASVAGLDAYESIYADSRKWLQSGWVDYFAPQLYWGIDAPQQSFPALLDWWIGENSMRRLLWPGLAAYRVNNGTARALPTNEMREQIKLMRARPGATGHIMFNATQTLKRAPNPVLSSIASQYEQRALIPASPWLDSIPPGQPAILIADRRIQITPAEGEPARWWMVRARFGRHWTSRVYFGAARDITLDKSPEWVVLNAVDQAGNVSIPAEWRRP